MTDTKTHDQSYYAATANDTTRHPPLQDHIEADVCIVGGGFSGVSAAISLAERGFTVALVEARRIGWGASGRNGGQVLPGWSGEAAMLGQLGEDAAKFLWRTRYRGNEIVEERIEKYRIDCDYVRGAITAALNTVQMRALREEFDEASAHGYGDDMRLVERGVIGEYIGTDAYIGGLFEARGAHCHPLNLCLGEARAAHKIGVALYEDSPALEITHGMTPSVKTAGGSVSAQHVILAGNAYHRLEQQKLGGYLLPAKTFQIATEPLPEAVAASVLPQNTAVCDANMVLDYYRLSADRRMLFGGRCTYSNRDLADVEGALAPRMRKLFPQLADAAIEFAWGGEIGIVLNRVPLMGRLSERVFYVQGYSGHGVNCSHIAGEILAEVVEKSTGDLDLFERIGHVRIPAAGLIGGPLLALGMTYYRIKDAAGL